MTTTTKALLATAVAAAISIPFLLPSDPVPTLTVVAPAKGRSARPELTTQPSSQQRAIVPREQAVVDDPQLILAEFAKLGGTIHEEYLDNDINNIIQRDFGNDRTILDRELAKQGLSLEQFRTRRREMMIISVMKARVTKGLTEPAAKQRAIDDWLTELRRAQ